MHVAPAPEAHFRWLEERAYCAITNDFTAIEAMDEEGRIVGMVGYGSWTPAAVECHFAVETPVAFRALIPAVFEYPFLQLGRRTLIGTVPSGNARSIKMIEHLGFKLDHRIKDAWDVGEDILIYVLRREDCRFLGKGKKWANTIRSV